MQTTTFEIQWWEKRTGQAAVLEGDGRAFAEVAGERRQGEEYQVADPAGAV